MTKTKSTKHALISSVLALFLCFTMLLGTTFAWFTDSVTSAGNKIMSGTLEVDLELLDKDGNWNSIKESKAPLFDYDRWEPGYTEVKMLKVENEGTLALKWYARFVSAEGLSTLADAIDVYVLPYGVLDDATGVAYPADRNLEGYTKVGTLREFVNTIESTTYGNLEAGESAYLGLALKMRESAGNEYQDLALGTFDIQILATQLTSEDDGFNNQYDADAAATISVSSVADLRNAIANVKNGETIKLADDFTITEGANGGTNGISYIDGVSFNLDLNGKTISSDLGNNALRFKIGGDDSTVTNTDVVINITNGKVVSGSNNWCAISASAVNGNSLTLNLSNMTVENSKGGDFAIKAWDGATVNLENVTLNSSMGGGVYAVGGTVNMLGNGNKITQNGVNNAANWTSSALGVSTNGVMNVYGGTYTADCYGLIVMSSGGTANIYGGDFATTTADCRVVDAGVDGQYTAPYNDAVLNIYGGNFDDATTDAANDGSITVWDWTPTDSVGTYVTVTGGNYGVIDNLYDGAKVTYATAVSNADELVAALNNGGGDIVLVNDIDLSGTSWAPVGTEEAPFSGTLNGNGHKISGLTIFGTDYAALIAYADGNTVIENLTLENVNIASTKHAAGVVCIATTEGLTIKNVNVSGVITAAKYAGGIVHNVSGAVISNCTNSANITTEFSASGIGSWVMTSTVSDCVNDGAITGANRAGGICGNFSGDMKNCTNNGAVVSNGGMPAGGIVGVSSGALNFENCTNNGDVTANGTDQYNSNAGGILGHTPNTLGATFTNCTNNGDVTAANSAAAGIVVSHYGSTTLTGCANTGAISGKTGAAGVAAETGMFSGANSMTDCTDTGTATVG